VETGLHTEDRSKKTLLACRAHKTKGWICSVTPACFDLERRGERKKC